MPRCDRVSLRVGRAILLSCVGPAELLAADRHCAVDVVGGSGRAVGKPHSHTRRRCYPIAHYKWCISQPDYDDDDGSQSFDEEYAAGVRGHYALPAIVGLVPIPVAWFLVYIIVWTVRWIQSSIWGVPSHAVWNQQPSVRVN